MMRLCAIGLVVMFTVSSLLAQDQDESEGGDSAVPAATDSVDTDPPDAEDGSSEAIHDELRQLRDRMFAAYESRDMEKLLSDVAEDVVITWQNSDRNEGHDEFLKFYDEMMNGDSKIVQDVSSTFEVDELSVLYGDDTAVARGSLSDHFVLSDGSDFTLNSKWTATVVKQGDAWKVASFHVSANIFDNPILALAQGWLVRVGAIAGVAGLIIGLLIGRASKRSSAA